jgi:hypothetical protein
MCAGPVPGLVGGAVVVVVELGACIAEAPPPGAEASPAAGAVAIAAAAIRRLVVRFIVEVLPLLWRPNPCALRAACHTTGATDACSAKTNGCSARLFLRPPCELKLSPFRGDGSRRAMSNVVHFSHNF